MYGKLLVMYLVRYLLKLLGRLLFKLEWSMLKYLNNNISYIIKLNDKILNIKY